MTTLLAIGENILKEHRKFEDLTATEVFLESTITTTLRLEQWQLKMGETTEEWGGAVRAIVGKGVGFSTFSNASLGSKAIAMLSVGGRWPALVRWLLGWDGGRRSFEGVQRPARPWLARLVNVCQRQAWPCWVRCAVLVPTLLART